MSRQFTSSWPPPEPTTGLCCDQCGRPIAQCRCIDEALQEVAEKAPKGRWTLTQTTIPPFDVESVEAQRKEGEFIPETARPRVEVVTLGLPQDPRVIILLPRDYPEEDHMKDAVEAARHWQRALEAAITRQFRSRQDGGRSYPPPRKATGKKLIGRDRLFLYVRRRRREGAKFKEIAAELRTRIESDRDDSAAYAKAANVKSRDQEKWMEYTAMSQWHSLRAKTLLEYVEPRASLEHPVIGWRRLKERLAQWERTRGESSFPCADEE
jgi:hypothetical protein